ncbi:MAG: hypothetical protein SGBAC_002315 [Bacillariaceae sp.]
MIRSHNNRNRIIPDLLLCIFLFLLSTTFPATANAQTQQLECNPTEPTKYDWETWNYYQLLDLDPRKSKELESKSIRKAYRKQAQIWHPDKHNNNAKNAKNSNKNNKNKNNSNKNNKNAGEKKKTSMEECTARFAKIAEAYEVLHDAQKREEYDIFLKHCRQQPSNKKSSSKWQFRFEKLMDPMQVFEEFFFGSSSSNQDKHEHEDEHEHEHVDDDFFSTLFESSATESEPQKTSKRQSQSHKQQHQKQKQEQQQKQPVSSYRHEEYLQDPYTAEEIIRIMQTEEYASKDPTTGKFYYRTKAQEFKKTFDPFTGMSYYPVSEPYILEEGYRYPSEKKQQQQQQQQQQQHSQKRSSRNGKQQQQQQHKQDARTILYPGDVLTPRSTLLVSPNQRYYAGLSPECELLVMAEDNTHGEDDDVIWSSSSSSSSQFPKQQRILHGNKDARCFATLRGPHLVVGMERLGHSHQVLWFSEAGDEEDLVDDSWQKQQKKQKQQQQQQHSTYLAQLDNDGSLVVYKVWNVPRRSYTLRERAFVEATNFVKGHTKVEYDVLYSPFAVTYRKCVYATGPLGCLRIARRLHELILTIYYAIKGFVTSVDNKLDEFMELLLEEDDFVRLLQSSLWNNGSSIGTKSARLMRKFMQYFMIPSK